MGSYIIHKSGCWCFIPSDFLSMQCSTLFSSQRRDGGRQSHATKKWQQCVAFDSTTTVQLIARYQKTKENFEGLKFRSFRTNPKIQPTVGTCRIHCHIRLVRFHIVADKINWFVQK